MPPGFAGMSAACLVDAVTGVPGKPSAAAFRPQLGRGFRAGHCWLAPSANSLKVMSPYLASSLFLSGLVVDFDYNEGGNGRQPAKPCRKQRVTPIILPCGQRLPAQPPPLNLCVPVNEGTTTPREWLLYL